MGARRPRKPLRLDVHDGKEESEEKDPLEISCDIGETTFRKGQLKHSQGVRIARRDETSATTKYSGVDPDRLVPLSLLGRGCSGNVVKAHDPKTNTFYAIKTVNNVYDKSQRHQIFTEIQTLYSLKTPWLVDFHGAYFKDHALSLILEYCDMGSLDHLGTPPEAVLASMTFQVLGGLQHLREHRHFHRDIKPQNILVTSKGRVKLTDFGLARELNGTFDMANTFVGTFKYMSPERIQNHPYNYTSDIWSLGLVLLEAATGRYPYDGCVSYIEACEVVQSIIDAPPRPLPADGSHPKFGFATKFSSEFCEFIEACLQKDPKARASADELLYASWLEVHDATGRRAPMTPMQ
ncbi:mitogen-activated protein kinase kinase [Achlya hypogyna]|uniref:mitogen-activated protein kinase kinase n=1 Tax=Achlya hypogyna TaxID=1202772 RepID=A0A1V9YQV6_ACHHY|nr:mitogen-activated protein kinase kinase [Achlya hypogyna]